MVRKRNSQRSSCPEGWLKDGIKLPVHGLWPSPMELEKQFNDLKHEPEFGMEYATEVSKFVAQGACRDFRRAYENWRNPTLNAERPTFKKKNR